MILPTTTYSLTILFFCLGLAWQVPVLAFIGVFFMVLSGFFTVCVIQARRWDERLAKIIREEGI